MHLATLIESPRLLVRYQIAVLPGGFSYGDDTGSGKAYGRRLARHLGEAMQRFLEKDTLLLGICNGFQILTNTGMLPGALIANEKARFLCRWVDLEVTGQSPWLAGLSSFSLPIAHGEGKYFDTEQELDALQKEGRIALSYTEGEMTKHFSLPANPNGSLRDIAGITAEGGRVLGLMPHPERGSFFTQLPHWTLLRQECYQSGQKVPYYAAGIKIFQNAVNYFH